MVDVPLRIKTAYDGTAVNRGLSGLQKQLVNLKASATGIFAGLITIQGLRLIGQAASASIDFGNALSTLDAQTKDVTQTTDQLIRTIQEVTSSQLSMAEAAGVASQAVQLFGQAGADRVGDLTRVAGQAATVFGKTIPEALNIMFQGIASGRTTTLRQIGLFVDLEKAAQDLADSLGKDVDQLTEAELSQSRLNATLSAGSDAFGQLAIDVNVLGRLKSSISDLGDVFTQVFFGGRVEAGIESLSIAVQGLTESLRDPEVVADIRQIATALTSIAAGGATVKGIQLVQTNLGGFSTAAVLFVANFKKIIPVIKEFVSLVRLAGASAMGTWIDFDLLSRGAAEMAVKIGIATKTLSGFFRAIGRIAGPIFIVIEAIRNWRGILTVLGSVVRTVVDILALFIEGIISLINLILFVNVPLDLLNRLFKALEIAIKAVIIGIEGLFRGLDVGIGFLRSLIGQTDAYTDALKRGDDFLIRAAEALGILAQKEDIAGDAAITAANGIDVLGNAVDSINTSGAVSQLDRLIGQFLDLSVAARNAAITQAIASGVAVPGVGPTRPGDAPLFSITARFNELVSQFGLGEVGGALLGAGRQQAGEDLRAALGLGGGGGGGGGGAISDAITKTKDQIVAAQQAIIDTLAEENRARKEKFQLWLRLQEDFARSMKDKLIAFRAIQVQEILERKEKSILAEELARREEQAEKEKAGVFKEAEQKRLLAADQIAKDFLANLSKIFSDLASELGDITESLGRFANNILGIASKAFGASLFGKGGFSRGGVFAEGGLLGGLGPGLATSAALGFGGFLLNRAFGSEKAIEIKQPLDIRITEIATHLLNFFNFRGLESRTFSSDFREVFEAGLY